MEKDHMRRGRGTARLWPHYSPTSTAPGGPLWACGFSGGIKRAQGGHPAPPALLDTSWETPSGLPIWGSLGKSVGLNHWESDRNREVGWVYSNQHSDLGGPNSYLHYWWSRDPSQGFCPPTEPRQCPVWPGTLVVNSDLGTQPKSCMYHGASSLALPEQGWKFAAPPTAECNF